MDHFGRHCRRHPDSLDALVAAKYRVITLDLPGHGKSDSPNNGKLRWICLRAVRAEAKVKRAVLVGHSMGGPVHVGSDGKGGDKARTAVTGMIESVRQEAIPCFVWTPTAR